MLWLQSHPARLYPLALFNPVYNTPKNLTTVSAPITSAPLPDTIQMSTAIRKRTEYAEARVSPTRAGHQLRQQHFVPDRGLHRVAKTNHSRPSSREPPLFALKSRRVRPSLHGISGEEWKISAGRHGSFACVSSAVPVRRLHRSIRDVASRCPFLPARWNRRRPKVWQVGVL